VKLAQELFSLIGEALVEVEAGLRAALDDASPHAREVLMHLAESGGKRVRPVLSLLSAASLRGEPEPAIPVAVAAEMIHMATLVHDDVIDRAETRRGRKTVNQIWGNHVSVLAGDALLAKALIILVERTSGEIVRIMSDMIYRMCEGEIAQHASQHDMYQEEQEYFDRIEKKTALFFAACCKAGALMGGASAEQAEALWRYGRHLGMAFQVVDDLLDVSAEAQVVGKPVGNDLRSGILTLPVLHTLRAEGYRGEAAALIGKGEAITGPEIQRVLELVRTRGSVEYAFDVARRFTEQAKEALSDFEGSGDVKEMLLQIADGVLNRSF